MFTDVRKQMGVAAAVAVLCLVAPAVMAAPLAQKTKPLAETIVPLPKPALDIAVNVSGAQDDLSDLHLSKSDTRLYRKIFAAQRRGDRNAVSRYEGALDDTSLIDWVRVRRPEAASIWLPNAGQSRLRDYHSPIARNKKQQDEAQNIALSVALLLKTDDIDRAVGVVRRATTAGTIDRIEGAQLWAQIAAAYLYANDAQRAQTLSHMALQLGGLAAPEAGWIAGLASWRVGDYARAARYFAWPARSVYAGPWMRSAASFWTARSLMRDGDYAQVSAWLREAAKSPRSFYGLIATRALGAKFDFDWSAPPFTARHMATLKQHPGAVRAMKLAQAGQMDMARLELALLDEEAAPIWREALSALAAATLAPDVALQVGELLRYPGGGISIDTALYPLAPWEPEDGYRLEPALMNAFIRQESRFKPAAVNKGSGATGLLQIMPRTARSVDRSTPVDALTKPETSLMLGQKYLEELLDMTDGNLFEAAIAYNAGPGNLGTWKKRFADVDDPLLFIELVPYGETRAYVERVMANYWIYSLRMGTGKNTGKSSGVATLDAIAGGKVARYVRETNRNAPEMMIGSAQNADDAPAAP